MSVLVALYFIVPILSILSAIYVAYKAVGYFAYLKSLYAEHQEAGSVDW